MKSILAEAEREERKSTTFRDARKFPRLWAQVSGRAVAQGGFIRLTKSRRKPLKHGIGGHPIWNIMQKWTEAMAEREG